VILFFGRNFLPGLFYMKFREPGPRARKVFVGGDKARVAIMHTHRSRVEREAAAAGKWLWRQQQENEFTKLPLHQHNASDSWNQPVMCLNKSIVAAPAPAFPATLVDR